MINKFLILLFIMALFFEQRANAFECVKPVDRVEQIETFYPDDMLGVYALTDEMGSPSVYVKIKQNGQLESIQETFGKIQGEPVRIYCRNGTYGWDNGRKRFFSKVNNCVAQDSSGRTLSENELEQIEYLNLSSSHLTELELSLNFKLKELKAKQSIVLTTKNSFWRDCEMIQLKDTLTVISPRMQRNYHLFVEKNAKNYSAKTASGKVVQLTKQCFEFVSQLPDGYQYETLTVPEDWSSKKEERKFIEVFYYYNKSVFRSSEPYVVLNGGPGGSSHSTFSMFNAKVDLSKNDVIFFDQRGTGCSSQFPVNDLEKVSLYGSVAIAHDLEVIRHNLIGDIKRLSLLAHSYGGLVAHRYFILYPMSVEHIYSYGYALQNAPTEYRNLKFEHTINQVDLYKKKYPQDIEFLNSLLESNYSKLCNRDEEFGLCLTSLFPIKVKSLLLQKTKWILLHKYIQKIKSSLQVNGVLNVFDKETIFYTELSLRDEFLMGLGIYDLLSTGGEYFDPYNCITALRNAENKFVVAAMFQDSCDVFGAELSRKYRAALRHKEIAAINFSDLAEAFRVNSQAKITLISGDEDIISPKTYYFNQAETFPAKVNLLNERGANHFGFVGSFMRLITAKLAFNRVVHLK